MFIHSVQSEVQHRLMSGKLAGVRGLELATSLFRGYNIDCKVTDVLDSRLLPQNFLGSDNPQTNHQNVYNSSGNQTTNQQVAIGNRMRSISFFSPWTMRGRTRITIVISTTKSRLQETSNQPSPDWRWTIHVNGNTPHSKLINSTGRMVKWLKMACPGHEGHWKGHNELGLFNFVGMWTMSYSANQFPISETENLSLPLSHSRFGHHFDTSWSLKCTFSHCCSLFSMNIRWQTPFSFEFAKYFGVTIWTSLRWSSHFIPLCQTNTLPIYFSNP